ncbi:hypothetical protein Q7C18_04695 [Nesterenkonia sp. CL21]|uniref:hypothetical protein n=1 Tax=Nesterenkonia sp. CL21 TaxID=3064894 RepID=UPI0028795C0C|nr:hypothetical protein [Nesterenkonia sp. CL21]MDS2171986.1 hypothetical protein [Nesterenkonia sp. CL21]
MSARLRSGTVLYRERMPLTAMPWVLLTMAAALLYGTWSGVVDRAEPVWDALGWAALTAGAIGVLFLAIWALPVVGEGKRVRVDESGEIPEALLIEDLRAVRRGSRRPRRAVQAPRTDNLHESLRTARRQHRGC